MTIIQELQEIVKQNAIWMKESKKERKEFRDNMRWMWYTQWEISEEILGASFERLLNEKGKKLNRIHRSFKLDKYGAKWEYDIVWVNWNEVFVCEIKTKLTEENVKKFIDKQLPKFKKYVWDYKGYKLFWVVWWRIIKKEARVLALKHWLYIIKETHDWKDAKILNSKSFVAKEIVYNTK